MTKRTIELTTERDTIGGARSYKPTIIRVRRITEYGGRPHYYLDGWPLPVPAWARHLDGRSVRGVVLAASVLAAFACAVGWAAWRMLFTEG